MEDQLYYIGCFVSKFYGSLMLFAIAGAADHNLSQNPENTELQFLAALLPCMLLDILNAPSLHYQSPLPKMPK